MYREGPVHVGVYGKREDGVGGREGGEEAVEEEWEVEREVV